MNLVQIFISLLAKEILGKSIDEKEICGILSQDIKRVHALYELSNMHDMAHIVCLALKNIGVWGNESVFHEFQRQQTLAVYRCEKQSYEFEKISAVFEEAGILYMPLKGVVIRHLYPLSWMRTSSDVDILVEENSKKIAQKLLTEKCGYTLTGTFRTENSFHTDNGICIELHHIDNKQSIRELPADIWTRAIACEGTYRRRMSEEMLYCHIVAHLAKHFLSGGCGLKPFFDMCIIEKNFKLDFDVVEKNLDEAGLLKAYKVLRRAMKAWLEDGENDELSDIIYKRVILSGSYGNKGTGDIMRHRSKGGKAGYILSLFVPDREEMERRYPILKEHPSRLPLYHVKRWGRLIFKGRIKSSAEIVSKQMSVPKESVKEFDYMIKKMGLDIEAHTH